MSYDCDICLGVQKVRLPVRRRMMTSSAAATLAQTVETSREYPCPSCADVTRLERVQAVHEEGFACSTINDPEYLDHVRTRLAHTLVESLLRHDFIKFQRGPNDDRELRFEMRATVGVVRPGQLDNLEERIAERQEEVANEVIIEAVKQVDNWVSHYGHAEILKRDATRLIGESIQTVLKRRASRWNEPGNGRGKAVND